MKFAALLALVGALGVCAAPSAGCGKAAGIQSGQKTVNVRGQNREYIVRVPQGYNRNKPYRLIFGVHWWGGSMKDVAYGGSVDPGVWNYYGLERLANETAIFVAPQGLGGNWYNEGGADFAFFDEIHRTVENALCVDTNLRFSIGFSWGGATSVSLACRNSQFPLRAITAIAAAGPHECNPGTAPVGYLGIHGISDNPDNGRGMRNRFMKNNGCKGQEKPAPSQGSRKHTRTDYECSGPPVSWVTFDGGHIAAPWDGPGESGSKTYVPIYAWQLFSSF